jgi:hypothetical protein
MLKDFETFVNENIHMLKDETLNENIFGKIWSWAGDLIKMGNIKSALDAYKKDLPEKTKERMIKEFELKIAKDAGTDTSSIEEEVESLKEEEQLIKDELKNEIEIVAKKRPNLKLKAKRLEISARKDLLVEIREMLKKFQQDEKYDLVKGDIANTIKKISDQEKNIGFEMEKLKNLAAGFKPGDLYYYTSNKGDKDNETENVIIITEAGKDNDGKDDMSKLKFKILMSKEEFEGENFETNLEEFKNDDKKELSDIKKDSLGEKIELDDNKEELLKDIKKELQPKEEGE